MKNLDKLFIFNSAATLRTNCPADSLHPVELPSWPWCQWWSWWSCPWWYWSILVGSWKRVCTSTKRKQNMVCDFNLIFYSSDLSLGLGVMMMLLDDLIGKEFYPVARFAQERKFWLWFVGENGGNWNSNFISLLFLNCLLGLGVDNDMIKSWCKSRKASIWEADIFGRFKSSFEHLKSSTDQRVWDCSSVSHHVDHLGKNITHLWRLSKKVFFMDFIRQSESSPPLPAIWALQLFLIRKFWTLNLYQWSY